MSGLFRIQNVKDGSEILISRGKGEIPRRLTPRECARLQGYPADFKIVVSDTSAYKQYQRVNCLELTIEHMTGKQVNES